MNDRGYSNSMLLAITCYNCRHQIERVLAKVKEREDWFKEIIVVDNRSADDTAEVAEAAISSLQFDRARVQVNPRNSGLGGSHKFIFDYASNKGNFSHVVILHGDDQADISDLKSIFPLSAPDKSFLGSRFLPESKLSGYSKFRIFGNRVFNALFSLALGSKVQDLGSGLNVFSREIFTKNYVFMCPNDLTFNCWLLIFIIKNSHYSYFPISWRETDQTSNVRLFSQSFRTLKLVLGLRFSSKWFRRKTAEHLKDRTTYSWIQN